MRHLQLIYLAVACLLLFSVSACASAPIVTPAEAPGSTAAPDTEIKPTPEATRADETQPEASIDFAGELEDFSPNNFDDSTNIDNKWFSLKPGMQWVYEGFTEEEGERKPHRVIFTVTNLTKEIAGVRTLVVWDQDYSAGVLEETELIFFAQDKEGNVWHLGQYPEVYEFGKLVETPAWITGIQGAMAGIMVKAEPQLGAPSYSQGWGPAVNWTDRAQVAEMGQQTCVPFDCFEDVLITEEFSREEPDAFQLKYYAPGVGIVRVGWKGNDATKETLELVEFLQLTPEVLAEVRAQALELEANAYKNSTEVYDQTLPLEDT